MNKFLKYTLIFGTLGVTGVLGLYFYNRYRRKKMTSQKIPNTKISGQLDNPPLNQANNNNVKGSAGKFIASTPFTNERSGNFFRGYINDVFPTYATSIKLDRTGSFNNSYIRRAWADYGQKYTELLNKSTPEKSGVPIIVINNRVDSVTKEFWK